MNALMKAIDKNVNDLLYVVKYNPEVKERTYERSTKVYPVRTAEAVISRRYWKNKLNYYLSIQKIIGFLFLIAGMINSSFYNYEWDWWVTSFLFTVGFFCFTRNLMFPTLGSLKARKKYEYFNEKCRGE